MARKPFKYGVLNPALHPQIGRTLDSDSYSGINNLSEAARNVNKPDFIGKLGFPLKGVVLKVEQDTLGNLNELSEGWGSWLFNPGQSKPKLWRCRVMIPELHSHLPVPSTLGPSSLNSITHLYPVFQAKDDGLSAPVVGEICYVDFGNRESYEDPIYLGMVKESGAAIDGGASSDSNGRSAAMSANANDSSLASEAPEGQPIGSGDGLEPNSQQSTDTPPVPNANEIVCKNTKKPLNISSPSCEDYKTTKPGLYKTASNGSDTGFKEMDTWVNRAYSNVLVLAASKHTLQMMEEDFIKETGIQDIDVKKFINSGYRNVDLQSCWRAKYDACLKEWKRKGGRLPNNQPGDQGVLADEKPSAVAKPGFSKHNTGTGVDFNADGTNRSNQARTTALWIWLLNNSTKYGWVNPPFAKNNPQEPWHFEFDEGLARSMGVFPRQGNS